MNKMKILITGGSGFIGRHLIRVLSQNEDAEIYVLSRKEMNDPNVTVLHGDVLNAEQIESIFCEYSFDVVYHFAAITEHHRIVDEKAQTFRTNLQGTINLLESFNRHCNNSLFVYSSTGKVYGKSNEMPLSESAYVNPQNILGKTKRITEEVIELYAIPKNQYLCCRIFNIFGEWQKRSFVVPTILDQLNESSIYLGALHDLRDYLYIDDLISAFIACQNNASNFSQVDYVNIGSGIPADVSDILDAISELLGRKLDVSIDKSKLRNDETVVEFCNNRKLREKTGWQPQYSLKAGLSKMLQQEGVL